MTSSDVVVAQLWRYPVKSMRGERLPAVEIQGDAVDGDRRWGVRDERTGLVLTGRREPRLLEAAAGLAAAGEPVIEFPDGTVLVGPGEATDTVLSDWLARPVRLIEAGDTASAPSSSPIPPTTAARRWSGRCRRSGSWTPCPCC